MVDGAMLFSGISIMTSLTLFITNTFQASGFLSFLDILTNTKRQGVSVVVGGYLCHCLWLQESICAYSLWCQEYICVTVCDCRSMSVSLCMVAVVCLCSLLIQECIDTPYLVIVIAGVYLHSPSGGGWSIRQQITFSPHL
jgi:hypothetical protein